MSIVGSDAYYETEMLQGVDKLPAGHSCAILIAGIFEWTGKE
jgi:hypothetical protein